MECCPVSPAMKALSTQSTPEVTQSVRSPWAGAVSWLPSTHPCHTSLRYSIALPCR